MKKYIRLSAVGLLMMLCLSVFTDAAVTVSAAPVPVQTENRKEYHIEPTVFSHEYPDIYWALTSDGVLEISGKGTLDRDFVDSLTPWYDYADFIKTCSIDDAVRVTNLGGWFKWCTNFTGEGFEIPEGVYSLYETFWSCSALEEIVIPKSVRSVYSAFRWCTGLKNVILCGEPAEANTMFEFAGNPKGTITLYYAEECTGDFATQIAKDKNLTVKAADSKGLMLSEESISIRKEEETTISYTYDGYERSHSFSVSNPNVAVVDEDGTITGIGAGKTTVTLSVNSYSDTVTAECAVTVNGGQLAVVSSDYSGIYDGKAHTASIQCEEEGITTQYGFSSDALYLTSMPSVINAGDYVIYYKISKDYYDPAEGSVKISIQKADGIGKLDIADYLYGNDMVKTVESTTHKTNGTMYYKKADASDDTYTTAVPTKAGTYVAKIVLPETANFKELVLTDTFTILNPQASGMDVPDNVTGSITQNPDVSAGDKEPGIQKGNVITIKGVTYTCASVKNKKPEFVYTRLKSRKATVTIPAAITYQGVSCKVVSVAEGAFKNDRKLKKLTIGKNVKIIGKNAFKNCKNLKQLTIKSKHLTKKTVGKDAFRGIAAKAKVKVMGSKVKDYKKILTLRGLSKKAKVTK